MIRRAVLAVWIAAAFFGAHQVAASPPAAASPYQAPPPEIGLPANWAEIDQDANGSVSLEECSAEQMSEDEFKAFKEWIERKVDEHDDGDMRDWRSEHFEFIGFQAFGSGEPQCGQLYGAVPNRGFGEQVTDSIPNPVDAAGDFVSDKVSEGFDKMVQAMASAADSLIIETTTAWLNVPSTSAANTDAANALQQDLNPLVGVLAALGLIVGAGQMAMTMQGAALRTQLTGIVKLMVVSTAGTVFIVTLLEAGDELANHLVSVSTEGGLDQGNIGSLAIFHAAATGGASVGGVLLLAILAILTSIIQLGMLLVRSGVVVVLAGFLPVAAAASMLGHNKMLAKTTAWLLGFICYKPAAAAIYAGAFRLLGGGGTQADMLSVIEGLMLLILAVAALPTAIRLFAPIGDMGGPSAAGVVAGGAAIAGGGMMLAGAGAGAAGGASGASISGGGMGTQLNAMESSTGPVGAPPSGGGSNGAQGPSGSGPAGPSGSGCGPGGAGSPGAPGSAGASGAPSGADPSGSGSSGGPSGARAAGAAASGIRGAERAAGNALDGPEEN